MFMMQIETDERSGAGDILKEKGHLEAERKRETNRETLDAGIKLSTWVVALNLATKCLRIPRSTV